MLAQAPAMEADFPPYVTTDERGSVEGEEEALEMYRESQSEQPAEAVVEQEKILETQVSLEMMEEEEIEVQDQKGAQVLSMETPTLMPSAIAGSSSGYPIPEELSAIDLTAPYKVPAAQAPYPSPTNQRGWNLIDWIKFALALVAVVTGMAAYLVKRRRDK